MEQCPKCNGPLKEVTYQSNSMLNRDQFDAVRAGDFYCTSCKGSKSSSGYKYFWLRELPQLPAREPRPITEIIDRDQYSRLKADSAELAAMKAERAADTERLRLALHACQVVKDYLTGLCGDKSDPLTAIRTIYHKPLLDAIDAARKEEK